jgi:hypothetical protein
MTPYARRLAFRGTQFPDPNPRPTGAQLKSDGNLRDRPNSPYDGIRTAGLITPTRSTSCAKQIPSPRPQGGDFLQAARGCLVTGPALGIVVWCLVLAAVFA